MKRLLHAINVFYQVLLFFLPWKIRRYCLKWVYGWFLHPDCYIGYSIINAKSVALDRNARIGHFNICKRIDCLTLGEYSGIGNLNKITGFPTNDSSVYHFKHVKNRKCELIIGSHTGITSNHYFDCNAGIYIGSYTQVAGFGSAFMTHSIDVVESIQDANPIVIGDYCFIGARCMVLKGVRICDKCVVSAMSLVNKDLLQEESLFGGVPAKYLKTLEHAKFFYRKEGAI